MTRNEISLFDLFSLVRRHMLLFVVSAVAMFLLVAAVTFFLPRKYRSEAQLQLKLGQENLGLDPATGLANQASVSIAQSPDQEINTIANVLKSRHLAALVVADVGAEQILSYGGGEGFIDSIFSGNPKLSEGLHPYHTLSTEDKAIWTVQDKIKVRPIKESNSLSIHVDSKYPEQAFEIVQSYVKNYKKEHRRIHLDSSVSKMLVEAADKCLADLTKKQNELVQFRAKTGLVAIKEQRAALVDRISKTKTELINAQAAFKGVTGEVDSLETALDGIDEVIVKEKTAGAGTVATSQMRTQLFNLEIREKELLREFDEKHYRVQNIQEQIKDVKKVLESEEENRTEVVHGPSTIHVETNAKLIQKSSELTGAKERIAQLKDSVKQLNNELLDLNKNDTKIDRMQSEIFVFKTNYEKFKLEADKAVRLDDASSQISNIRVVPPTMNPFPVFPIIPLNLAVGVILAGLTGLACAYWGERRHIERRSSAQPINDVPAEPLNNHSTETLHEELEGAAEESSDAVSRIPR